MAHELRFTQTIKNGKVVREDEDSTLKLFIQKGMELGFALHRTRTHLFQGCDDDGVQAGDGDDKWRGVLNPDTSYSSILKIKGEANSSETRDESKGHIVTLIFKRSRRTAASIISSGEKAVSTQNVGVTRTSTAAADGGSSNRACRKRKSQA
eukprot:CAMPEP_0185272622 /NCGR_PEP_ID=MMETSP1359-20130426/47708_1 /TAXON_ID=552665 /ORGANISM="Bigelowiella longifila, Strain CCMP242" /LENGTH=151 /DNA_ID=CAMNT_0027864979 /DNA_START=195 /DNA_END=650 /DNA_ORIENTATION=-